MRRWYRENRAHAIANAKAWRKAHPKEARSIKIDWRRRNPGWGLWLAAKMRAKRRGIMFDIVPSDIHIPETCPYLGIPLKAGLGRAAHGSPSLDRIDPSRGYVPGNIEVISWRANRIKYNASIDELRRVLTRMEAIFRGKDYRAA